MVVQVQPLRELKVKMSKNMRGWYDMGFSSEEQILEQADREEPNRVLRSLPQPGSKPPTPTG